MGEIMSHYACDDRNLGRQPRNPGDDPETPTEAEAEREKERIAQNLESILAEEADYLGLIKQAMLREAAAYIRKLP